MKRILILSAGTDPGRGTVARQLAGAFAQFAPRQVRVDVVDPAEHVPGWCARLRRTLHVGATATRKALLDLLRGYRPDLVAVLQPAHAALLAELDRGGRARDFAVAAFVTEIGETGWTGMPVDAFLVPNEFIAATLSSANRARIKVLGFPTIGTMAALRPDLARGLHLLWIVNGAKNKASKLLHRLLEQPGHLLTIVSDDPEISALVKSRPAREQVDLVTDFNRLPALLARHHLAIAQPETALWHEAIAAGCPLIAFRPSNPAEVANAGLLQQVNAGGLAGRPREVAEWIERATRDDGRVLRLWCRNVASLGRANGAEAITTFLLGLAGAPPVPVLSPRTKPGVATPTIVPGPSAMPSRKSEKKLLLCDLHTHTTWSDGKLTVPELVDFYGQRGFDCICVTDHLCDPDRLLGKLVNLTGLVIAPDEVSRYFAAIEREKKRAWSQYKMLLLAGIEFNKDGYTPKTSAHLLGVDLKRPIDPSLDIPALIGEIHAQGGLAIASHPHEIKSEWGRNTLFFWEHVEEFAPLLDAWEIANRDDLFNPVGLRKLPFIASSDFHKPKHIHSWKTLLWCEKDPAAIKECIRQNRDVSLTLYRDHRFGLDDRDEAPAQIFDHSMA